MKLSRILTLVLSVLIVSSMLVIAASAEVVYYENDFSDPATLSHFTQYRGIWEIKDGALYYEAEKDGYPDLGSPTMHSFILFTGDPDAVNLEDYTIDVDMLDIQTQGGVIFRADSTQAREDDVNAFFGYLAFVSFTGEKPALGRSSETGSWKGNIWVGDSVMTPGMNIHIRIETKGLDSTYTVTNLANGSVLATYTDYANIEWINGTFGFRLVASYNNKTLVNLNKTHFDNLKVTVADGQKAANITATAPAATTAATTTAAPVTTTAAPAATTAAPAATTDSSSSTTPTTGSTGLLAVIAIAAAAATTAVLVIKKKRV